MIHPCLPIAPRAFVSQLLQKVQHGTSPLELIYVAHDRWPFLPGQTTHPCPTLRMSIFDSSFNPPTLAHLALANSLSPSESSTERPTATPSPIESYDAQMLLLSLRNADKVLKPGDATLVQRLDMMYLLSCDMRRSTNPGESLQTSGNIAIAIINEPTFVGKSAVLLRFLHTRLATVAETSGPSASRGPRSDEQDDALWSFPELKLTFLLGFDTLIRLFSPKYYPSERAMVQMLQTLLSPDQRDCRIVCAHRRSSGADKAPQETQDKTFRIAHQFITGNRIAFIDIGVEEQTYSSTEVRGKVATGDDSWKGLVTGMIANYIVEQGLYAGLENNKEFIHTA